MASRWKAQEDLTSYDFVAAAIATYEESRNTDPGEENVEDGVAYEIYDVAKTGTLSAGGTIPPDPVSVSAAAGDGQVVLTVDADGETDIIYARYKAVYDGDWSVESETFKRTGDGDITVTGLVNGTKYYFAVYTSLSCLTSDWITDYATPVDASGTAPTDVLSDNVRPRARGPWAVLWLSSQTPWAYERIKVIVERLGRLR